MESLGNAVVIIATHDCDLAQSPEAEPQIEVIIGCRIDALDGNFTHAKSPRTLHIKFDGDARLQAEFVATAKRAISKTALLKFAPRADAKLSSSGQATFQRWLTARYRRSAFPDEFERRLVRETKLAERIAKAVKPHGELIVAVLFDVDEGQDNVKDGPDDVYILDINILYSVEGDVDKAEAAAELARKTIHEAFEAKLLDQQSAAWRNIELRYCEVISEEALTYRQFSLMKPWRLEYMSFGADPQQPILVS